MALETLLGFGNVDSTENINARLSGLIPKGIIKGGIVVPEPSFSMQVRIKGDGVSPFVLLAMSYDGMVIREKSDEHVLTVVNGITNAIVLKAKYYPNASPIAQFEVMSLSQYEENPDKETLIRICTVYPKTGAASITTSDIDMTWRDEVDGLTRQIVRGVVSTKEDLPETSGSPAEAEVNFISNTFSPGTAITVTTPNAAVDFPLIAAINFKIADPQMLGLSRINPTQILIRKKVAETDTDYGIQKTESAVVVFTDGVHSFEPGFRVLIQGSSATAVNQLWTVSTLFVDDDGFSRSFGINAESSLTTYPLGQISTGGLVTNYDEKIITVVRLAPGVTHTLTAGDSISILGAVNPTFDGSYAVETVINDTQFTYLQPWGFPSADSGGGSVIKNGVSVPLNAVQIGDSGSATAKNFETVFLSTLELSSDIEVHALGSSLQFTAEAVGELGNSYTITKVEPNVNVENQSIVISGFKGGVSPNPNPVGFDSRLMAGDLFVVLHGVSGLLELWGFDGIGFRNLTSGSLLDIHRKNLFSNEIHVTDNEKAALLGTVGIPSGDNRFVTQQDTSQLSKTVIDALNGADGVPPSSSNRYLTEARLRAETAQIIVPEGQDYAIVSPSEHLDWDGVIVGDPYGIITVSMPAIATGVESLFINLSETNADVGVYITGSLVEGSSTIVVLGGVLNSSYEDKHIRGALLSAGTSILGNGGIRTASSAQPFFNLVHTPLLGTIYKDSPYVDVICGTPRPQLIGKPLRGLGIRPNTTVVGIDGNRITLSASATVTSAAISLGSDLVEYSQRDFSPVKITNIYYNDVQLTADYAESTSTRIKITSTANLNSAIVLKQISGLGIQPNTVITAVGLGFVDISLPRAVDPTVTATILNVFKSELTEDKATNGVFPSATIPKTSQLLLKFSATPDNGSATLLCSAAVREKKRNPSSDMLAMPQTIVTAEVEDALNRVQELRFNNGIKIETGVNGRKTKVVWPANLFKAANLQGFLLSRRIGDQPAIVTVGFNIDFELGTASSIVNSFTPITFQPANWSRYVLAMTPLGKVNVYPVSTLKKKSTDLAFASDLRDVAQPCLPFLDGSYVFACVGVYGQNTNIEDILETSIELYPYNESREFASPVICGLSYGHFVGTDSHIRAASWAPSGTTIVLLEGTYEGTLTIDKANITLEGRGAILRAPGSSALVINQNGFVGKGLSFTECNTAIEISPLGIDTTIEHPLFSPSVVTKIKAPQDLHGGRLYLEGAKTWYISDGSNSFWAGDFNSPDALQAVQDVVEANDKVVAYRGTYNKATISKSHICVEGFDGEVYLNGLTVSGDHNSFSKLRLLDTLECTGKHNRFVESISFDTVVFPKITFPETTNSRHFNSYSFVCGKHNEVTVGDGVESWGDYVGIDAINLALNSESSGTTLRVFPGTYNRIVSNCDAMRIIGSGVSTKIRADVSSNGLLFISGGSPFDPVTDILDGGHPDSVFTDFFDTEQSDLLSCIRISGDNNRVSDLYLFADGNETVNFKVLGIKVLGNYNVFENIIFETENNSRIESHRRFISSSGYHNNSFIPHTGSPTGYVSWTVGDGVKSMGDFNGLNGIQAALNALPNKPHGIAGVFSSASGSTVIFTDGSITDLFYREGSPLPPQGFSADDLYRHVNVTEAASANVGAFRIVEVLSSTSVRLERLDGGVFINESGLTWDFTAGAKIIVLPGQYQPFEVSRNHVEIEAWPDVNVVGEVGDSVIVSVTASFCRIKGLRLCGGSPTAYGFNVTGKFNTFNENIIETANRFNFVSLGNLADSFESPDRSSITVSRTPSRADFFATGTQDEVVIQRAITLAQSLGISTVILGDGAYSLSGQINLPPAMALLGSGFATVLTGNGTFPAISLDGDWNKICDIRFSTFSFSVTGTTTKTFVDHNWLVNAPIDPNVTGLVSNLTI